MSRAAGTATLGGSLPGRPAPALAGVPLAWLAAALLALLAGPLTFLEPTIAAGFVLAAAVVAVVAAAPPLGAYLVLGTTPFIAGLDRGQVVPVLRPSEALLGLVVGGLVLRGLVAVARGAPLRVRPTVVDRTLVLLAVTGSVLPLLWLAARGRAATTDDVLYALQLWKFTALFVVIRVAVRREAEVRRCLIIALSAACVLAAVAVLQALNLAGVRGLLAGAYTFDGYTSPLDVARGSATLGSPIVLADVMVYSLAISVAWALRDPRARPALVCVTALLLVGLGAAGQYSGYIGLVLALVVLGLLTRRLGRLLLAGAALLPLAAVVTWPVVAARLSGFENTGGLPQSWVARWEHLSHFFWPRLGNFNWVLGVQPAARVPNPGSWQGWIWIESGYTWLLWTGGVLLLAAFAVFLGTALHATGSRGRVGTDTIGVAAVAAFTGLAVMAVLMIFDPHLTMRGSADLLFPLLALALVVPSQAAAVPAAAYQRDTAGDDDATRAEPATAREELERAYAEAEDIRRELERTTRRRSERQELLARARREAEDAVRREREAAATAASELAAAREMIRALQTALEESERARAREIADVERARDAAREHERQLRERLEALRRQAVDAEEDG